MPNSTIPDKILIAPLPDGRPYIEFYRFIDEAASLLGYHPNTNDLWLDTFTLFLCGIETSSTYYHTLEALQDVNPLANPIAPGEDGHPIYPDLHITEFTPPTDGTALVHALEGLKNRIQTRLETGSWFDINYPPAKQYVGIRTAIQYLYETHSTEKDIP